MSLGHCESFKQCVSYGTKEDVMLRAALGVSEAKFEENSLSEQDEILQYFYANWQDLQQDSSVVEALKETRFVMGADGDLHKPKHLFDPCDELLTSIFSGEVHKFPGERFISYGWLNVLRKTGLQNTSDADNVIECARRVEFLGAESMKHAVGVVDNDSRDYSETTNEVSAQVWSLAETLINVVFERFAFLYSHNFCSIFGKITCIPAEFGFPFESGKEGVKRVLCSYSEAVLLKDWALAWTTAPILTRESLVPPEYSWGALQLTSPPPFTKVLKHLKAEVKHTKSSLLSIEEASFEILKYLDTIWGTLSSSDIFELQQVTFIAAENGTHLVTCGSLFVHLTVNLSPLASKLPSRYLPFLKILKKLGVRDMLSITSAMNILSSLQKSGRDFRLNPNELHAVIELLHFLCNENTKQKISEMSNGELQLVVPDTDCRLVYHNTCVYVDPHGSRYVKFIEISKLRVVHHSVSERLCLAFRIRKLSDVVVEELDHAGHLQTLDGIGSTSLAAIKRKLLNRSFQVAVSSLLNSVLSSTSGSKTPDFLVLQRSLESVAQRLKFVHCIYTRFWLLPKRLDITLASKESITSELKTGPSQQVLYYVDRSETCMLIAKPPSYVSVPDLVALLVSQVLGSPVPLPIGSLFLCSQDSESALLDILKLSSYESVIDGVGYGIGFLGRDIVLGDAKKRQIDPLRAYYQGEIVAWQSQSGEKLKYGRIPEDVRPLVGQTLYSLNVETFPGKTETFISSHVFSFQNFPVGREYPTYVRPGVSMHVEQPDESQGVAFENQASLLVLKMADPRAGPSRRSRKNVASHSEDESPPLSEGEANVSQGSLPDWLHPGSQSASTNQPATWFWFPFITRSAFTNQQAVRVQVRRPDNFQPVSLGQQSCLLAMNNWRLSRQSLPVIRRHNPLFNHLMFNEPEIPNPGEAHAVQPIAFPAEHGIQHEDRPEHGVQREDHPEHGVQLEDHPAPQIADLEQNMPGQLPTWRQDLSIIAIGVFVFCSTPLWSMPYHEGGWYGSVFFFFFSLLTFLTAASLPYCVIGDNNHATYPDLGYAAFGRGGRLAISRMCLFFSCATCVDSLMILRDNLSFLYPQSAFWPTICFLSWLVMIVHNFTLDEYNPVLPWIGIVLTIIVWVCLAIVALNGVGLDGNTVPFNYPRMHFAIGFFSFCFCGHSYMPHVFATMRNINRYWMLLSIIYVITTAMYFGMGWTGYRMFGEEVNAIITLNLTSSSMARQIAIYSVVLNQMIRYALNLTPVAITVDGIFPEYILNVRSRLFVRLLLVIMSMFATLLTLDFT